MLDSVGTAEKIVETFAANAATASEKAYSTMATMADEHIKASKEFSSKCETIKVATTDQIVKMLSSVTSHIEDNGKTLSLAEECWLNHASKTTDLIDSAIPSVDKSITNAVDLSKKLDTQLGKVVPTGETPVRQTYQYPRQLTKIVRDPICLTL